MHLTIIFALLYLSIIFTESVPGAGDSSGAFPLPLEAQLPNFYSMAANEPAQGQSASFQYVVPLESKRDVQCDGTACGTTLGQISCFDAWARIPQHDPIKYKFTQRGRLLGRAYYTQDLLIRFSSCEFAVACVALNTG